MKLSTKSKLKVLESFEQFPLFTGIKTLLFECVRESGLEEGNKKMALKKQDAVSTYTVSVIFCSLKKGKEGIGRWLHG